MYAGSARQELDRAEFEAARLGFCQLLRRKRMSPEFVERHGEDLFAQACFEYSRRVSEGEAIGRPAAWIVACGWHRTVSLLERRDRRPRTVSTERLAELGGDEASPEQEFLAEDRHRKVREAVERLPTYQRRLLALSYFEGESVREAARRLGWTASKAQRAHRTARRRLRGLLAVEWSDELAVEVGLAAFLSLAGGGRAWHVALIGGLEGALDALAHPADIRHRAVDLAQAPFSHGAAHLPHGAAGEAGLGAIGRLHHLGGGAGQRLAGLGRRVLPGGLAEGGVAAAGGAGQAAEVCKALAAVCLIGGGAVTGALIAEGHHGAAHAATHRHRTAEARPRPRPQGGTGILVAQDQAPWSAGEAPAAETPDPAPAPHPVERRPKTEQHRREPEVRKAKPPPTRPEGEFEPSPEAPAPEPELEAAPEPETETEIVEAARTTTGTSSSSSSSGGGGGATPKAVPAGSPGEFEP